MDEMSPFQLSRYCCLSVPSCRAVLRHVLGQPFHIFKLVCSCVKPTAHFSLLSLLHSKLPSTLVSSSRQRRDTSKRDSPCRISEHFPLSFRLSTPTLLLTARLLSSTDWQNLCHQPFFKQHPPTAWYDTSDNGSCFMMGKNMVVSRSHVFNLFWYTNHLCQSTSVMDSDVSLNLLSNSTFLRFLPHASPLAHNSSSFDITVC